MDSPGSRLTPLDDDVPLLVPFDAASENASASSSIAVTTRSRTRKRAAVDTDAEPPRRLSKRLRKGKEVERSEASGSGQTQTQSMTAQAERRRADLLKDPHARMIDLFNVQCSKCGVRIKLSQKGLYDLHHWDKHRKRCNKWSEAYAARKRAENGIDSSRLSTPPPTPPLTEDLGTEFTATSARSPSPPEAMAFAEKGYVTLPRGPDMADKAPSPAPRPHTPPAAERVEAEGRGESERPVQPRFPLSSHEHCAKAIALHHPGLEPLDLNRPLEEVPAWSWACVNPSIMVFRAPGWAQEALLLSTADWEDIEVGEE